MKHIYLVVNRDNWTDFKIGFAKNVGLRLSYLQTGNSAELSIADCALVKNPKEIENLIHRAFYHKRIRGEWYSLTPGEAHQIYGIINGFRERCSCRGCLGYYSGPLTCRKDPGWKLREGVYAIR